MGDMPCNREGMSEENRPARTTTKGSNLSRLPKGVVIIVVRVGGRPKTGQLSTIQNGSAGNCKSISLLPPCVIDAQPGFPAPGSRLC
jgi:hypothetical protein